MLGKTQSILSPSDLKQVDQDPSGQGSLFKIHLAERMNRSKPIWFKIHLVQKPADSERIRLVKSSPHEGL